MDERKRKTRSKIKTFSLLVLALSLVALALSVWIFAQSFFIEDPNSCFTTHLYKVELCENGKNYVKIDNIPKHLVQALILSEDASFYSHEGFDWFEIKASIRKNWREKRWSRGGSTLTQQLAKNLYLSKEKSLLRKAKEFFIAKRIEEKLSKKKILEKYLNVVEFGPKIYGIKPAAAHFFAKSPQQLNILESAYLISLLPSPIRYSRSFANKKLSKINLSRMNIILRRMSHTSKISADLFGYCQNMMETWDWPFYSFDPNFYYYDDGLSLEEELSQTLKSDTFNDEWPDHEDFQEEYTETSDENADPPAIEQDEPQTGDESVEMNEDSEEAREQLPEMDSEEGIIPDSDNTNEESNVQESPENLSQDDSEEEIVETPSEEEDSPQL